MQLFRSYRFGFVGCGHMAQALISGWAEKNWIPLDHILVTNRSEAKLKRFVEQIPVKIVKDNIELLQKSDVVILATKPQDLNLLLDELSSCWEARHTVISLAAGVSLRALTQAIQATGRIIRLMPNTPIQLNRGVIGYCLTKEANAAGLSIEELFSPLGEVVHAEEGESFEALTVATSSGIGFIFELMQYWKEWLEEHDFSAEEAQRMTVQTFLGASQLAAAQKTLSLQDLQAQVTSKKGVTEAGLKSLRELEVERALRYSFEKAVLKDRELGKL